MQYIWPSNEDRNKAFEYKGHSTTTSVDLQYDLSFHGQNLVGHGILVFQRDSIEVFTFRAVFHSAKESCIVIFSEDGLP